MKKKVIVGIIIFISIFPMRVLASNNIFVDESQIMSEVQTVSQGDIVLELPEAEEEINEGEETNAYEVFSNCLNAQLCDEQLEYLSVLYDETKVKYEAEKAKLDIGYTTSDMVMEAEAQLKTIELQMDSVRAEKAFYLDCVHLYGGEYGEIAVFENLQKPEVDYVSLFLEDSAQIADYNRQIQTYQNYIDTLHLTEAQLENIFSQMEVLERNKKQYETELQIYVKQKILQYENALREIKEFDYQIAAMENRIAAQRLLYEEGKIAKAELMGMETELQYMKFQRVSTAHNAQIILYILDNTIEN